MGSQIPKGIQQIVHQESESLYIGNEKKNENLSNNNNINIILHKQQQPQNDILSSNPPSNLEQVTEENSDKGKSVTEEKYDENDKPFNQTKHLLKNRDTKKNQQIQTIEKNKSQKQQKRENNTDGKVRIATYQMGFDRKLESEMLKAAADPHSNVCMFSCVCVCLWLLLFCFFTKGSVCVCFFLFLQK